MKCVAVAAAVMCLVACTAKAQDTRNVVEPKRPPACAVVTAELAPVADTTLAERDEYNLDTPRIQAAIEHCGPGRAVVLRANGAKRAFLTGPLTLARGVTLVVDTNTILFGSRDARVYDIDGRCGTVDQKGHGCKPLISATGAVGVGIMGPGTIDGRGWAKILGQNLSWWDLAQDAKVRNLSQSCPRLIVLTKSNDATLYDVTLKNSGNFHVVFERASGFTVWGIRIDTRDPRARNTDGVDPTSAENVTITRSFINTGDDNVAIKAGKIASTHMTVSHNHFYRGHGMSIGSETDGGASAIRVFDLSVDGADNGLRIKSNASRGGLVHDIEYRDVCIRRTKEPILMDTHYTASPETTGKLIPEYRDIRLADVRVLDGGKVTLDGYDGARRLGIAFNNVVFDDPKAIVLIAQHVTLATGPGPSNLTVTGEDVKVTGSASDAPPNPCTGKFLPMPVASAGSTPSTRYAAIVDARFRGADGDSSSGTPTFHSLGAALTALPPNGVGRAAIFMKNGRYHEKLTIDRPYVSIVGENRDSTVLTFDAAADTPSPGGGTYGTRGSFTLRIVAPDFHADNLTIENAFDYPANVAKPDSDKTKLKNMQAVALMLDLGSDRATFVNVKITGFQDTLFPNSGRSYFARCEVWGHVDFIFGAGQAVFDDCDIVSRDRGSKTNNGYVTAASTDAGQPYGFLFVHSRLKKEHPEMAANSVTLGRPWHPFANPRAVASVAFIDCWMDDHIGARGWDRMSSVDSTGTRVWYEPSSARFVEYRTKGPGALESETRRVLSDAAAVRYTPSAVLTGWTLEPPQQAAEMPLWADGAPGSLGDAPEDRPAVTPFIAPKSTATGGAIVVFPGGGYEHLAWDKEGTSVARWLNGLGISAFVVRYRLGPRYHYPTMLLDARRALRVVRSRAAQWNVDPSKIGVMGFSAGGHLASMAATQWTLGDSTNADVVERASSRPDLAMLVYPVITMTAPYAHAGSRLNLIGERPVDDLVRATSSEVHVTRSTPPTFIVVASDDETVPVQNSLMYYDALHAAGVPAELHVLEAGGHGFGLAPTKPAVSAWLSMCESWLRRRAWVR